MKMTVFIEHDLPCFETKPFGNSGKWRSDRWFLHGNMNYDLSDVEIGEHYVWFELRYKQGLIGTYYCYLYNWERLVKIIKTRKTKKKNLVESED